MFGYKNRKNKCKTRHMNFKFKFDPYEYESQYMFNNTKVPLIEVTMVFYVQDNFLY